MKTVEIYFNDLNTEAKKEVLDAAGVNDPSDMNWDFIPLAILDFEEESEEDCQIEK